MCSRPHPDLILVPFRCLPLIHGFLPCFFIFLSGSCLPALSIKPCRMSHVSISLSLLSYDVFLLPTLILFSLFPSSLLVYLFLFPFLVPVSPAVIPIRLYICALIFHVPPLYPYSKYLNSFFPSTFLACVRPVCVLISLLLFSIFILNPFRFLPLSPFLLCHPVFSLLLIVLLSRVGR